ncbi:ABC transporter permease [Candidatus Bipolaricaulota bacterium]|nr:ABC transporter permease [Candidatus Bipolaricaulota bacterium]
MKFDTKKIQLFVVNNLSWFLIIAFYLTFAALRPTGMLSWSTIVFMIHSSIPLGFLVVGEALCLIVGGLDVSLAQMAGFVGMLSALVVTQWAPGLPGIVAVFLPVIIGLFMGAINGFFIGYQKLNPFLVTLGTFMGFEAGTLLLHSYPIYSGFPENYLFGGNSTFSIPIFVGVILLMAFLLNHSRAGLYIYGVGGNAQSSRMLGVNPGHVRFLTFTLAGGFAGLSGLFYTGFLNTVPPSMGDGDIFLAFAGAIIGGVSLEGGRGSMTNAFAGLIFLALIEAGLSMFNVDPNMRRATYGILVLFAIIINRYRSNVRDRLLQPAE